MTASAVQDERIIPDFRIRVTMNRFKTKPIVTGYGCPCIVDTAPPLTGWDARLIVDEPLLPGQTRDIGIKFLTETGRETCREAGRFFLWEGKIIGIAQVL